MTKEKPTAVERGAMGGDARAAKLPSEQRKQIARKAAEARWGADMPQASHDGPLKIGDTELIAAVLPNRKRLLSQGTFLLAIGRSRTPKAGTGGFTTVDDLPFFLQAEVLKPFISEELLMSTTPILFRTKSGQRTVGYDAMLLPMVCEVYLRFRDRLNHIIEDPDYDQGAAEKRSARTFLKKYRHIIKACDVLTRGLARRGIIALVDDATGYQADKAREELEAIIKAYIAPGLMPWTQTFPHEFFRQVYRLHDWEYRMGCTKHPQYVGKFINKYIYEALPPGVLEELKRVLPKNERGNRRAKLWQALTVDTGNPHLDRQLTATITLMQVADDKKDFEDKFSRVFGKQARLPLVESKGLLA